MRTINSAFALATIVIIATSQLVHADEPMPPPGPYQDCIDSSLGNPDKTVCVTATPDEPTVISITTMDDSKTDTWQIPQYYRHSFLSLDGQTLITTNSGGLITLTEPPLETILLSIWQSPSHDAQERSGSLVRHITVGDFYESIDDLETTISHHRWGEVKRSFTYDKEGKLQLVDSLFIQSVDNRTLIVDMKSGSIEDWGDISIDASNKGSTN